MHNLTFYFFVHNLPILSYIRWQIDVSGQSNIVFSFFLIWCKSFIGRRKQNNTFWSGYVYHPPHLQWLHQGYQKYFLLLCFLIISKYKFKTRNRSSHQRCSVRKDVYRNFAEFTGKRLFFNKVAQTRPVNLFKNRLWRRCFLWILRNF